MKSKRFPLLALVCTLAFLSINCGTLNMNLVNPKATASVDAAATDGGVETSVAVFPQSAPSKTDSPAPTSASVPTAGTGISIHADLKTILDVDGSSVQWSPDGQRLYVGGRKLHIFDARSFAEIRSIAVTTQVLGIAVSPDGSTLAVIDESNGIVLIDAAGGNVLRTLPRTAISMGRASNSTLAFTPDGATLAAVVGEVVKLFDVATGEEKGTIVAKSPFSIAVSPEGKSLYAGGWMDEIQVWDIATGEMVRTFGEKSRGVNRMTLSPDGRLLVSAGPSGGAMILWDAAAGSQLRLLSGHKNSITSMAFSPDGRLLASASDDVTIKLWDTSTGRELQTLIGHSQAPQSIAISPDGTMLASASQDGTTRLWTLSEGAAEPTPTVAPDAGAGPDLRPTQIPLSGRAMTVENAAEIKRLSILDCIGADNAVWSPDGKWLVGGGYQTHFFDAASRKEIRNIRDHFYGLAVSPDSKVLAGYADGKVILFDLSTGAELRRVAQSQFFFGATYSGFLAFSPDSATLAVIFENVVKLYDVASGAEEGTIVATDSMTIAVSPDGRNLYAAGWGGEITVWDIATRTQVRTFGDQSRGVNRIVLSYDGRLLASAATYGPTILWDTATGRQLQTFTGHTDSVESLAFSPDGKLLFTASRDVTIRVWDIATGTQLAILTGHTDAPESIAVSPDGATLASAAAGDGIYLWGVPEG
jgi:WD40 repeat protein